MREKATNGPQKVTQVTVCRQHLSLVLGSAAKVGSWDKLNMLSDMAGFQMLASLLYPVRGSRSNNAEGCESSILRFASCVSQRKA